MYIHKTNYSEISDSTYYQLDYNEKQNYRKKEESSSSNDIIDTVVDIGIGLAISSIFDDSSSSSSLDYSSNDSSSGFDGGFGGGDFSGGGAGGDW